MCTNKGNSLLSMHAYVRHGTNHPSYIHVHYMYGNSSEHTKSTSKQGQKEEFLYALGQIHNIYLHYFLENRLFD